MGHTQKVNHPLYLLFPRFKKIPKPRSIGFDLLRAAAIILVLFNHSGLDGPLARFGWLGVDLFFVLSGFLISGLLFEEYKNTEHIRIRRFLIRRSIKILPPFYFFIFISLLYGFIAKGNDYALENIAAEIFFLQNYYPGIWRHTWSLGLEEQFYTSLIILLMVGGKYGTLDQSVTFLMLILSVLVINLILKLQVAYLHRETDQFFFIQTHLRAEGIIFGVLLAYLYHFTTYLRKLMQHPSYLAIIGLLLISPGLYINGGSYFMNTLGLSMANIGFTLILLATITFQNRSGVHRKAKKGTLVRFFSMIGIHSYSIYLWHLNAKELVKVFIPFDSVISPGLYIFFSILVGVSLSLIVEKPILSWRDRHWN